MQFHTIKCLFLTSNVYVPLSLVLPVMIIHALNSISVIYSEILSCLCVIGTMYRYLLTGIWLKQSSGRISHPFSSYIHFCAMDAHIQTWNFFFGWGWWSVLPIVPSCQKGTDLKHHLGHKY